MPNIFSLPPNDRYGNRLVLDLESSEKQQILALFDLDDLDKTNMPVGSVTATTPAAIATKNASAAATAITIAPIIAPSSNQKSSQQLIIAIDPGHGGEDPGAIGPRGTLEKDIVLQIARILKTQINNKKNMRAYLIRNGDYYISLRERMVRARQHKADLFISLHADAFANITANGASVFVLSERGATSAAAKWLARSQNQSDTIGGVRLKNRDEVLTSVLLDLSQTANATASLDAAKNILLAMQKNVTLHKDHVEQANFMVLKAPDVPSVLVETGFISHPKTELKLRDKAYQQKIVGSIVRGVEQYFSTAPSRVR
jgi:N-acetylmuramoyl-L-alanine amidase